MMRTNRLTMLSAMATLIAFINVAFAAPATLVQTVTYNSETITMRLTKENLRGANFELLSQNSSGGYDAVAPVDERSYIGSVDGYPDAVSCGILQDDGLFRGAVYFDRGLAWFTLDTAVVETRGEGYEAFTDYQIPTSSNVGAGQAGSNMYGYDLGIDADHNYFTTAGSSVAKAFEQIEYSVCSVRAIYMRDVLLRPYLGRVIIRSSATQDPYAGTVGGGYLDAIRLEWNNNQTDTDPDLVAGVSPSKIGGGLAWVGVVGTTSGYSANQSGGTGDFGVVFRHEMGHNWGCGHYVGGSPEGTGLMGGNWASRFSGCEVYNTLEHRDSKQVGILDNEGTYTAIELPPYASLDSAAFTQTVDSSVTIDVTANDHDANGQSISLSSFDSTSGHGGTVTQQGQNLVYTPSGSFVGTDYFHYTISDTTGKTGKGVVVVDVVAAEALELYLNLDEVSGTVTSDNSPNGHQGTLQNGMTFDSSSVSGQFGNALAFTQAGDIVSIGEADISGSWSASMWVRKTGSSASQDLLASDNFRLKLEQWNGTGKVGLTVQSVGDYSFNYTAPLNTWVHLTFVGNSSQTKLYVDGALTDSIAVSISCPMNSIGTSSDPLLAQMDDLRVYSRELTEAEITGVISGGWPEAPSPFDGASEIQSPEANWVPTSVATSYEVYLGTSQAAVAAATTGSPEYQGTTAYTNWTFDHDPNVVYFWRVDAVSVSGTVTGAVWSFTTDNTVIEPWNLTAWHAQATITAGNVTASNNGGYGWVLDGSTGVDYNYGALDALEGKPVDGSTVEYIFNLEDSGAAIAIGSLLGWSPGTEYNSFRLEQWSNTGKFGITAEGVADTTMATDSIFDSNVHVVFVHNGTGLIDMYINGVYAETNSRTSWRLDGGMGKLGANSGGGDAAVGVFHGVASYDAALNATQIADLYNAVSNSEPPVNNAPTWNSNPITEATATEDGAYNSSLADNASDPDSDPLTFSKVSGPAWLSVSSNGDLSGTPSSGDVGLNQWTVRVTDDGGLSDDASLQISVDGVTPPADPPSNPSPVSGTTGTSLTPILTWDAASGADSYDIYFGTTAPGDFVINQTNVDFEPDALLPNTTYYWRVDTVNGGGITTGTVWSFTTGPGGSSTLFSDDFESGSLSSWSISSSRNVTAHSSGANGGVYGVRLKKSSSMTATVDTSAVSSVTLEYDRKTAGFDNGESLTVEWSADGSSWTTVEASSSTSWATTNVVLPAGAAGQAALQIRIVTNANRNNEYGYVDNVTVSGN